jgi:hypothetical protein
MKKILPAFFLVAILAVPAFCMAQESPAPATVPGAQQPSWLEYKAPYAGEENNIANPHRTAEEMATWSQQAVADMLSFGPADYKEKLIGFKKYFVESGWQLYTAYLKDAKIVSMVGEGGYSVGAIVNDIPENVSHGAAGGAYHWVMKMPITISFFTTDPEGNTKTGASGKYLLYMDIVRVAEGGEGENGIAIDNWRVDPMPKR